MSDFVLYELQGCPHCMKVKDKLSDLNLECEPWMALSAHAGREEVEEVGDRTGVLVLVDGEHSVEGMPKSDDIVDYLEETYSSAA